MRRVRMLVAIAMLAALAPNAGANTLRINLQSDTDFIDPALAYYVVSWQFEYDTCLKLLNYPERAGVEGSMLVPDAARGMPTVSADGRTYTFTLKRGLRFSTGEVVT